MVDTSHVTGPDPKKSKKTAEKQNDEAIQSALRKQNALLEANNATLKDNIAKKVEIIQAWEVTAEDLHKKIAILDKPADQKFRDLLIEAKVFLSRVGQYKACHHRTTVGDDMLALVKKIEKMLE